RMVSAGRDSADACLILPDGSAFAIASDRRLVLFNLAGGASRSRSLKSPIRSMAFPPGGRAIVLGDADGNIHTVDPVSMKEGAMIAIQHKGPIHAITYEAKGLRMVTAGEDRMAVLRDLGKSGIARPFKGHGGAVYTVAITSDGKWLASGSRDT